MPGPITQEYILRGTAQFDDIQNKVSQIQNFLNKLQLPTNLKTSFTQTFNQLQSSAQKASNLIQQGFNTKGNITSFNKEINNITASFDKLGKDMAKISPEMLEKSVPMLAEYKQKLNDISKQMQDVRSQMQQNVGQQWKDSIEGIVAEMSKLSGSGKIGDFAKEFKAGNLEEARNILNDITRTVGHFKDTTKTANFKAFTDQLYQGLSQVEQSSAELQQRLGQLGQEYTNVAQQGVTELTQGLTQQDATLKNAKKDLEGVADNTNKMADASVRAANEIDQFKNKLTYFFGLNNGIQLVRRAFTKLIQTMKELDEVMTQTAVVTDYTVSDMWSQLPEITARANELGVAIKGVYEADMLFYQQGLKTNQVMELSNESMKMARIAGLDAKTATDRMTNALRGFNMELDKTNAQRINDVYNALAARTASNVQEISSAMTKVASLANSANMSFENTAAFLAQIVETTRESAETAGTALKTVIARFSEVKKLVSEGELTGQTEEGEEIDVNKVSTALRAANIDLNEYLTGAKGLDQIFMELSSKWDSLDIVTQRYIATMAAGSRQQSRFIALMQDYSRMQELTGIATNANGAAQQQFEKTLESFETVVNRLKNAWNSFLLGLANNEVIKGAINLFTGLINTVSKLIDTLSLGSSWIKTFLTGFLAIGTFKVGKTLTTKMFAGMGALMRGEGAKAGTAFTQGLVEKQARVVTSQNALAAASAKAAAANSLADKAAAKHAATNAGLAQSQTVVNKTEFLAAIANEELTEAEYNALAAKKLNTTQLEVYNVALEQGATYQQAYALASSNVTKEEILEAGAINASNAAELQKQALEKKGLISSALLLAKNKIKLILYAAELKILQKDTVANAARIGLIKEETADLTAQNAVLATNLKLRLAAFFTSPLGKITMVVAGIAAITAGIIALINSGESAVEFAKRMRASADAAKAAAEKANEKYQELKDNLASLAEEKDTLKNLTYGTTEWAEQLDVVNNKILDILKVAPELAKYLTIDETGQLTLSEQGQDEFLKQQKENATQLQNAAIGTEMAALEAEARKLGYDLVGDDSQANQNIARVLAGDQDTIEKLLKEGVMTQEQLALAQSGSTKNIEKFIDQMGGHENANDISEYLAYGEALLKSDAYRKAYGSQLATNTIANVDHVNEQNQKAVTGYMLQLGSDLQANYKEQYKEYQLAKNVKAGQYYRDDDGTYKQYTEEQAKEAEKTRDKYLGMGRDLVRQLISAGYTDVEFDEDSFEITYKEGDQDFDLLGDEILARMNSESQAKELEERGEKFALEYTQILNSLGDIEAIREKSYEDRTQAEKDALANATILEKVFSKDYNNINEDEYSRILNDTNLQNMIMSLAEDQEGVILKNIAAEVAPHLEKIMKEAATTANQTVESIRSEATAVGVDEVYLKEQESLLLAALKKKGKVDDNQLKKEVSQLVARNAKIKASAEELISSYDKWQKLIQKNGSIEVFDKEDREVFNDYVTQFNRMFGITTKLDESFYKDAENINLLTAALNNDKDAYEKLAKKVATEQLDIKVGFNGKEIQGEAKTALETVQSFITNFDLGSISTGDVIDNQGFINACKTLLETGAFTATQLQSIFSSLNLNFNAGMVKYTVGKNGKVQFTEEELYKDYLNTEKAQTVQVSGGSIYKGTAGLGQDIAKYTDTGTSKGSTNTMVIAGQDNAQNRAAFKQWMKENAKVVSSSIEITAGEIPDFSGTKDNKGGSDKSNFNLSQIDEYTNTVRHIAALEQKISDIEAKRSNILAKHTGNAKKYTELVKQQLDYLDAQKEKMEWLQDRRLTQLTNFTDQAQNGADWKVAGKNAAGEEALISVKDYAQYISWDKASGKVEVNWAPYNASTDEIFKSNFDAVLSAMESVADEYLAQQQKILKAEEDQIKLMEESRDSYQTLQDKVKEMLVWERQQEIDALTAIDENINNSQSEIMDSIQKQIDLERQIRDNTKKEDEISDIENQIAFLSRDTSGANDVRIKELQKQLGDMTEEYSDTLVDQELQRIADANEQAAQQRERQIDILTKSLEYDQERGLITKQAFDAIYAAWQDDGALTRTDALYSSMMAFFAKEGASVTDITISMNEFKDSFEVAGPYILNTLTALGDLEGTINTIITRLSQEQEQITAFDNYINSLNEQFKTSIENGDYNSVKQALQDKASDIFNGSIPTDIQTIINSIDGNISFESLQNAMSNATVKLSEQNGALTQQMTNLQSAVATGTVTGDALKKLNEEMSALNKIITAFGWNEAGSAAFLNWLAGWNNAIDTGIINSSGAKNHLQNLWDELIKGLKTIDPIGKLYRDNYLSVSWKDLTTDEQTWWNNHGGQGAYEYFMKQGGNSGGAGAYETIYSREGLEKLAEKANEAGYSDIAKYFNSLHYRFVNHDVSGIWQEQGEGARNVDLLLAVLDRLSRLGYASGGLATSTGPAWLDGTPNRPEYVLNPVQTEAFLQLPDLLRSLDLTAGQNVSYGDTSIEINIQVDQLASDYDVEQLAEKIKTEIYDDSAYRNVNSIGWIR